SAEDGGKRASKRPERSTPLRPDVELEFRGVLVERGHPGIDILRVTPRATETGKVVEQSSARPVCHEVEILLVGRVSEEGGANQPDMADRALEPWTTAQVNALAGELDPALRDPIAQDPAPTTQAWCPKLKTSGVPHELV